MVHEVELSSIPTLDISVGVTVNGQNLHPLISKDEEFRLYIRTATNICQFLIYEKPRFKLYLFL